MQSSVEHSKHLLDLSTGQIIDDLKKDQRFKQQLKPEWTAGEEFLNQLAHWAQTRQKTVRLKNKRLPNNVSETFLCWFSNP